MVYFKEIQKTEHYKEFHERQFPWLEVITVIVCSKKQIRKKDGKLEIETERYYILCELKDTILYVINAKRK